GQICVRQPMASRNIVRSVRARRRARHPAPTDRAPPARPGTSAAARRGGRFPRSPGSFPAASPAPPPPAAPRLPQATSAHTPRTPIVSWSAILRPRGHDCQGKIVTRYIAYGPPWSRLRGMHKWLFVSIVLVAASTPVKAAEPTESETNPPAALNVGGIEAEN